MPIDMGDLPGWLEAIGTVGAFAVTTRLLWLELRRRREALAEQIREQASKVSFIQRREGPQEMGIRFSNLSHLPVRSVTVHIEINGICRESISFNSIPPDRGDYGSPELTQWVNGHARRVFESTGIPEMKMGVVIDFTDANGRRWRRDENGYLEALPSDPPDPFPEVVVK
ncbi:hypothetical protein ABTZ99_09315 [Actinosynnema sp. NPDC002837]